MPMNRGGAVLACSLALGTAVLSACDAGPEPELVHRSQPATWVEGYFNRGIVSPDGSTLLLGGRWRGFVSASIADELPAEEPSSDSIRAERQRSGDDAVTDETDGTEGTANQTDDPTGTADQAEGSQAEARPPSPPQLATLHESIPGLRALSDLVIAPGGHVYGLTSTPAGDTWSVVQIAELAELGGGGAVRVRPLSPPPGLPAQSKPAWSADGSRLAFRDPGAASALRVLAPASDKTFHLAGAIIDYAWKGPEDAVVALVDMGDGAASLFVVDAEGTGASAVEPVRVSLDGAGAIPGAMLSVAGDGSFAAVSAVATGLPHAVEKHDPEADRDLDIFRVDLATGSVDVLASTEADDFAPQIVQGHLYWTAHRVETTVVVLPVEGGEPRDLVEGEEPHWRPDGGAIGFGYGGWRAADWALNREGGMVSVDADARVTSEVTPVASGFHEDFAPVWSPDGRWIAYHSHRSDSPVLSYGGLGSTDDVYIRPGEGTGAERRLTDWGYEMGTPAWSPDSRELLVSTFDEAARGHVPWAIQIDPESGEATGREPLRLPGSMGSVKAYAWSEDGSQIAISAEEGDSLRALWIVNRTGGAGRVTAYVSDTYGGLDWLPGGDRLVVTARLGDHARLFAVTPNTGRAAPLTPEGMNVILPEVSPDGRWIAATRIETTKDVLRIGLP